MRDSSSSKGSRSVCSSRGLAQACLTVVALLAVIRSSPAQCIIHEAFQLPDEARVLAAEDSVLVTGEPGTDIGAYRGTAFLYRRTGNHIVKELEIIASAPDRRLGVAADLDTDRIAIGASGSYAGGPEIGGVLMYDYQGGAWSFSQRVLATGGLPGDLFGETVALEGTWMAVGAPGKDVFGTESGAVYLFELRGGAWVQTQMIAPTLSVDYDLFGSSIAMDQDVLVVGAYGTSDVGLSSGAAYVYRRQGTTWNQQQKLTASDARPLQGFGLTVDLEHPIAVIAAEGLLFSGSGGAVYLFEDDGTSWSETQKLVHPFSPSTYQTFGDDVSIEGDLLAVGDINDDDDRTGGNSGSVMLFRNDGTRWDFERQLRTRQPDTFHPLGEGVALDGDWVHASGYRSSEPYVFELESLALSITPSTIATGETVTFRTCLGTAGRPTLMLLVSAAGTPMFRPLPLVGSFNLFDEWIVSGTLLNSPGPIVANFRVLSLDGGKLIRSQDASLTLQ